MYWRHDRSLIDLGGLLNFDIKIQKCLFFRRWHATCAPTVLVKGMPWQDCFLWWRTIDVCCRHFNLFFYNTRNSNLSFHPIWFNNFITHVLINISFVLISVNLLGSRTETLLSSSKREELHIIVMMNSSEFIHRMRIISLHISLLGCLVITVFLCFSFFWVFSSLVYFYTMFIITMFFCRLHHAQEME